MKILKVEKDKVQMELTAKEVDAIVFCLDGPIEDLPRRNHHDILDDEYIDFCDFIASIEEKFVKTGLIKKENLALVIDE